MPSTYNPNNGVRNTANTRSYNLDLWNLKPGKKSSLTMICEGSDSDIHQARIYSPSQRSTPLVNDLPKWKGRAYVKRTWEEVNIANNMIEFIVSARYPRLRDPRVRNSTVGRAKLSALRNKISAHAHEWCYAGDRWFIALLKAAVDGRNEPAVAGPFRDTKSFLEILERLYRQPRTHKVIRWLAWEFVARNAHVFYALYDTPELIHFCMGNKEIGYKRLERFWTISITRRCTSH